MSSVSNTSAFEAFDRMASKVDQIEAEAEASKELEDATSGADLNKQFKELEKSSSSADLLLDELKAKMIEEDAGKTGR